MIAFEGDVPAHRLEKGTQHVAEGLRIGDRLAMADGKQHLGQILGGALILEMLGLEPGDDRPLAAARNESGKHRLLLQAMTGAQQRHEIAGDGQTAEAVDTPRQIIGDRLERDAELDLRRMQAPHVDAWHMLPGATYGAERAIFQLAAVPRFLSHGVSF